jgi:AraC-like DNA-binding protein
MLLKQSRSNSSAAFAAPQDSAVPERGRRNAMARFSGTSAWYKTGKPELINPIHLPKHSAVFVQSAARALLAMGVDQKTVFGGTAFSPEFLDCEQPVADFADSLAFMEHAAAVSGDDLFGHRCGLSLDPRCAGIMYYAALTAPTLEECIRRAQRYSLLFNSVLDQDASGIRGHGTLRWSYRISPSLQRRQLVEMSTTVKYRALNFFAQQNLKLRQVRFQHLRRRNASVLEKFFGCEIIFGAPENAMVFSPSDLELPVRTSDKHLAKVLRLYGDQALSLGRQDAPALVLEVERVIADQLADGQATLENVAQILGMSARTLSRKLSQEGTSFFKVLEDLRKAQAVHYLRDSDMVLAEIAFLLGYSGLSSFNDAFKRWTGVSPGQFRIRQMKPV